jgi:hypothetical protein
MGLFQRKKYYIDDAGKKTEYTNSDYKSTEQLEKEYKESHPSKWEQRRRENRELREEGRKAYKEEFRKARISRMRQEGKQAGGTTWSDRLENFSKNAPSKVRPIIHTNYSPPSFNRKNLYFGGSSYKPRIKKSSKRYAVVGGKAYPVAGHGKNKKRKKGRSSPFDNSDFFKW